MVADAIYDILHAQYPAWPLSVGDLPASNLNAVSVMEYDGYTNISYFGTGDIWQPIAKIVVRNASYAEAQEWCDALKDTLHRYHDDNLISVLLVGGPMYLGRGEQKLHEFQLTFTIQLKE